MSRSLLLAVNCLLFRASRDTKCFDTVPSRTARGGTPNTIGCDLTVRLFRTTTSLGQGKDVN